MNERNILAILHLATFRKFSELCSQTPLKESEVQNIAYMHDILTLYLLIILWSYIYCFANKWLMTGSTSSITEKDRVLLIRAKQIANANQNHVKGARIVEKLTILHNFNQ